MKDTFNKEFPDDFGASPDDFLQQYGDLIYKMIYKKIRNHWKLNLEPDEVLHDFFIFLRENNFKKLRVYRGECSQKTYLGIIFHNFFIDKYSKRKYPPRINIEETRDISVNPPDYNDILKSKLVRQALKKTFNQICSREKLIFILTFTKGMRATEISGLLKINEQDVYENNRKVKKILRKNLGEFGIEF